MGYLNPLIANLLHHYHSKATGRMLDIGCGDKPYENIFIDQVTEYVGCDYLTEISIDKETKKNRVKGVDVICDGCNLSFSDSSFNTVLSTQLIEHLPNPASFFSEVSRVLVDNGVLFITFPLFNPIHEEPYDYFRYTEYGVKKLCEDYNLNVENVKKLGGGWHTVGYLVRYFLYRNSRNSNFFILRKLYYLTGALLYGALSRLDNVNRQEDSPINYLIVARKLNLNKEI